MKIDQISKAYQNKGQNWFHFRIEHEMFSEALQCFVDRRYALSASIGFVLFERIFTTRFIRETSFPKGFVASKDNTKEQMDYILDSERRVVDGNDPNKKSGLRFKEITKELNQLSILSDKEKDEYDDLYTNYRIPVLHGLSYRYLRMCLTESPLTF